jgi:hypothetical protein
MFLAVRFKSVDHTVWTPDEVEQGVQVSVALTEREHTLLACLVCEFRGVDPEGISDVLLR